MRLQHPAGHVGVSAGRVLSKPFSLSGRSSAAADCGEDSGPIWDPVKALGGVALFAILAGSAWLEWQLVKWLFSNLF